MILVSGATGQLGHAVVTHLLKAGAKGKFAVLARDAAKAKPWTDQGIETRIADFDRPETLASALAGVDKFLFISTMSMDRGPQQAAVVDAAANAGVKHIFYTGLGIKDIARSHVAPLMQSHFDTEDRIRNSGMAFTFFRNTIYAEALLQLLGPEVLNKGIALPDGAGRVPYASRDEMGEGIANALLGSGHEGKTYDITASQAWTFQDVAAGLSQITGKPIGFTQIPAEALQAGLAAAGLPEFVIWLTLGTLKDIEENQYDIASADLSNLLGRQPKALLPLLREIYA